MTIMMTSSSHGQEKQEYLVSRILNDLKNANLVFADSTFHTFQICNNCYHRTVTVDVINLGTMKISTSYDFNLKWLRKLRFGFGVT